MTNPTNWLDVMPALPLAPGVPVKLARGGFPALAESIGHVNARRLRRGALVRYVSSSGDVLLTEETKGYESAEAWRVDLETPAGFAYSLRLLLPSVGPISRKHDELRQRLVDAYLNKRISSADRLVLAQALKEVNR